MGNFVLVERLSKAKHLQTIAGVQPATYWVSTFIWDTVNYQMPFLFTGAQTEAKTSFQHHCFCFGIFLTLHHLFDI